MHSDLSKLHALTFLDANYNSIRSLPPLGALSKLLVLQVAYNDVSDDQLILPTSLVDLNLYSNKLSAMSLLRCPVLTRLTLSRNKLSSLSGDFFASLQSLKSLDLWENNLTSLPASLFSLTSLERLLLASNQLSEISEDISRLTLLSLLVASDNRITALPTSVSALVSLKSLDVRKNPITALPRELGLISCLQVLFRYDCSYCYGFSFITRHYNSTALTQELQGRPATNLLVTRFFSLP
jgi:leucine-rich repeat protein SHOC2